MSTLELSKYIGQTALLTSDKLRFAVQIIDAKMAYGSIRLLVSPVNGVGQVWVDRQRIELPAHVSVQIAKQGTGLE